MEGFGWYTFEVTKRMVLTHPEHEFIFFFDRKFDKRFLFAKNVQGVVLNPPARHPLLFLFWFEWSVRRALKFHEIDVFFSPDGYLSLGANCKQVGVIHDINFEHFPKDLPWFARVYLRTFFPLFAKKASKVITVSNYSKEDIAKTYGILPEKIIVGHNGASEFFKPMESELKEKVREQFAKNRPYFLFVGSLQPRKNLIRLFEAYQQLVKEKQTAWDLVIVGSSMWKNWSSATEELQLSERIHFLGHLDQTDLIKVVGAASAFVYVPYFEGFGIPLVEAMQSGVPIVSGNRTSLPEVAGDAAIYCDPMSVEDIAEKMKMIESSTELRESLIAKGLLQAKKFNWDLTAEVVWKVLAEELNV